MTQNVEQRGSELSRSIPKADFKNLSYQGEQFIFEEAFQQIVIPESDDEDFIQRELDRQLADLRLTYLVLRTDGGLNRFIEWIKAGAPSARKPAA